MIGSFDSARMYRLFAYHLALSGLSVANIASAAGVSNASLSDWKNGKSVPRIETLVKIADVLGVSLDQLVFGEEETVTQRNRLIRKLVDTCANLDDDQIAALLHVAVVFRAQKSEKE